MPLPQTGLYGSTPQMGGANGGSFAQKQPMPAPQQMNRPMRPQMGARPSVGGVNAPKLGAGGSRQANQMKAAQAAGNAVQALQPAQGLSPSYARPPSTSGLQDVASRMNQPLINTPPAGPSEQGYGQTAYAPSPSMAKLQPTGGVQMGAANQVGLTGPMYTQETPAETRNPFAAMGIPTDARGEPLEDMGSRDPREIARMQGMQQLYGSVGGGIGPSNYMDSMAQLRIGATPDMDAVGTPGLMGRPDVMRPEPVQQAPVQQTPIGPSPQMMPQMQQMKERFTRRR